MHKGIVETKPTNLVLQIKNIFYNFITISESKLYIGQDLLANLSREIVKIEDQGHMEGNKNWKLLSLVLSNFVV
jgi:predicted nucleic acid-binding protein